MTELTPQEKYQKLVEMGKLPPDCFSNYLNLALELAETKTKIAEALKALEGCCDKDACCLFTDDGVCYDDECLIAEAKTILSRSLNVPKESQQQ